MLRLRHVAAVAAGNCLEFYDFLSYAFFAAQIGRTFFPSHEGASSLLPALATFGAGFVMRPVGAFVIGLIADRIGRKPAMMLSFTLMGLAMGVLALIPPYSAIGVAAPIAVIACRLVQGFALGGEVGPSTAFLAEAAPARRRGFFVSLQYVGQDTAVFFAGVIGLVLALNLTPAQLDAWGWRVAFGIGVVIVPLGLILRSTLAETLHHEEGPGVTVPADRAPAQPPSGSQMSLIRLSVLGLMMLAGGTTVSYVLTYLTTYTTETLHMSAVAGFIPTILSGGIGIVLDAFGGILSDRYGRKAIMVLPWSVLLVATIPLFYWVSQTHDIMALATMTIILSVAASISGASVLVSLTESLPKQVRAGGLGLLYAFAISIFGGSTQFIAAWLTGFLHSDLAPAFWMTGGVALALAAMLMLPETAPNRVSPRR